MHVRCICVLCIIHRHVTGPEVEPCGFGRFPTMLEGFSMLYFPSVKDTRAHLVQIQAHEALPIVPVVLVFAAHGLHSPLPTSALKVFSGQG